MKNRIFFALLFGAFAAGSPSWGGEKVAEKWEDVIRSEQGSFAVSVQPKTKTVEVKKIDGNGGAPPHVRVRILRPDDRPLELRLRTVERLGAPPLYTGTIPSWNDSYMGLEVDFSFDKKTWKKLGNLLRKAVP